MNSIPKTIQMMSMMSIDNIGIDIIEIERIREGMAAHSEKFLSRLFTKKEQEYCLKHKDPAPSFAGRFAAKEAIAKALGTGLGEHLSWLDIEIFNAEEGKPGVHLSERANKHFGSPRLLLSISHCKLYATAVALKSPS